MQFRIGKVALAVALAASAGGVLAQQQHGRDSVYANPAEVGRPGLVAVDTAAGVTRLGRDSVYATTSSTPTSSVAANATSLQQHGRSSVYAIQLDAPAGDITGTRIGRALFGGTTTN